MKGFLK